MPLIATASKRTPDRAATYERRRMEILRQVALEFAKDGYHQTSVNSLATRLGVSKPVLYYYAKNKDDLLFQCGKVARGALQEAMDEAKRANIRGIDKIRRFFGKYAEIMCGDFGRCLVLIDRKALGPAARKKDAQARRGLEDAVRAMISEGQADGTIVSGDRVMMTRALFGAFNGIPHWYHADGPLTAKDVADSYLDLFIAGLGQRT
jgi:AcrR family transcriptional regulator